MITELVLVLISLTEGPPAPLELDAGWVESVVDGRDELPSLRQVQRAAVRAMLLPDAEGWASRARWSGLVPRVDVSLGTDADIDIRDTLTDQLRRTTLDSRGFGMKLSLRFGLHDLVFNPAELTAARLALAREAAVRARVDRVTQLYFERVEVLAQQRRSPGRDVALELRAAELDGLIESLTTRRSP